MDNEEIKQEELLSTNSSHNDRHTLVDEYSDIKELEDGDGGVLAYYPASNTTDYKKFVTKLTTLTEENIKKNFNSKFYTVLGCNNEGNTHNYPNHVYEDFLSDKQGIVNNINYGDTTLDPKLLKFNATPGRVTGTKAISVFSSALRLGETPHIDLVHSGIWVTLRPPTDIELVNLEIALTSNELNLGRSSNTLVYSNYGVVLHRIFLDFVMEHIINHNVQLPDDISLLSLIDPRDIEFLALGLINAMYPDGYEVGLQCKNTLEVKEDGTPACDFRVSAHVKPFLLRKLSRSKYTDAMKEHMSKKRPGSVTVAQVRDYQLELKKTVKHTYEVKDGNGKVYEFTFKTPNCEEYVDNGEAWVDDIINMSEEIFSENDSVDVKNTKIRNNVKASIMGIYNTYVEKISTDGNYAEGIEDINRVLASISGDKHILVGYIKAITEYINNSVIGIVATSAYVCPNCKGVNEDVTTNEDFKEFIPFSILHHFFNLSTFKVTNIQKRDENIL